MTISKITFAATFLLVGCNALAIDLPSDEEMIRQGRSTVGSVMPKMTPQMVNAAPMAATPMQQPEHLSPLAKELMKETFDAKLPKTQGAKSGQTDLIIFVSFSMPDEMLASYSKQAKEAGAILVLRGLVGDSMSKTQARAATIDPVVANWQVNPGMFRKFKIDKVPSIVLVDDDKSAAEENGCALPAAYIRVDGDVSIRQALSTMGWRGEGHLALLAKQKLQHIEEH